MWQLMKKLQAQINKRLVAAMLVTMAVIGLSALATRAPTQNRNTLVRSLKNIQTDKTTLFYANNRQDRAQFVEMVPLYANNRQDRAQFVEMVLPGTSESDAATENLKWVAATL